MWPGRPRPRNLSRNGTEVLTNPVAKQREAELTSRYRLGFYRAKWEYDKLSLMIYETDHECRRPTPVFS